MNCNWTDKEIIEYKGDDIIIATGVPGSKWSGIFKSMSLVPSLINNSCGDGLGYGKEFFDTRKGEIRRYGWHYGKYWGPHHDQGHGFDDLRSMTKKEILVEFMKPYENWDMVKIIKSHWFAYDLDYLIELFPHAKVVACYLPDDYAFKWWHKLGGWDIKYPPYDWYVNDAKMKTEIRISNGLLLKFFTEKGIDLKAFPDFEEVYKALGYEATFDFSKYNRKVPTALLGIFNGSRDEKSNKYIQELMEYEKDYYTVFEYLKEVK
jgi:hypothetical protein